MGRPSKLTPARQARILELIRQGVPQAVAAQRSGLGETQFYDWCRRGRAARSGKYRDFWEALQVAQATAEATMILQLRSHMRREWRAVAWMLERRWPDRWKQIKAVEAKHEGGPPGAPPVLIAQLADMTPDQLAALSGLDLDGMGLPLDDEDEDDGGADGAE